MNQFLLHLNLIDKASEIHLDNKATKTNLPPIFATIDDVMSKHPGLLIDSVQMLAQNNHCIFMSEKRRWLGWSGLVCWDWLSCRGGFRLS